MALDPNLILAAGKTAPIDPASLMDAGNRIALGHLAAIRARQTQDALSRVQSNPDDPDAVTQLAALDPAAGNAYLSAQAAKRAVATRSATADVIRAYAPLGSTGTPAATTPASILTAPPAAPAVAPAAPPAAGNPPALGAPTPAASPQPAAAPPQTQPLAGHFLDHTAPATQAVGAAVTAGQLSPTEAVARLAESADPAQVEQVLGNLKTMDGLRLSRLSEANNAIGAAAQSALQQFPNPADVDKRRAFVMQMAPDLAQHGVTPDQLAGQDYSTAGLSGRVGQAIGTQALIAQANEQKKLAQTDASQAETHRHNVAGEEEDKGKVVPYGSAYVGSDGKVLYDGSAGGAAAGRTTGGWTPRIANGGDNTDAAVNSKIAGAAQFLGVKPGDSIANVSPMKIAQAMTLSEGGAGSVADRNNNPANIRNSDGSYKTFPTKQAGLQAAAALVARKIANGQTTVQTMIEGLPQAGSGGGGAGGMTQAAIDLAAREGLAHGGVVPGGYARNRAAQAAITNRMADLAQGQDVGSIIQGGQTVKSQGAAYQAFNKPSPTSGSGIAKSLSVSVEHLDQLQQLGHALNNGNVALVNRIGNALAAQTGGTAPTNFNAIKGFVTDEVVKGVLGGPGAVHDRAQKLVDDWQSNAQTDGVVKQLQSLMAAQLQGQKRQYEQTTGRNDFTRYVSPRANAVLAAHGGTSSPPPQAIAMLRSNPSLRGAFEQKYGAGSAASVLGQ